MCIEEKEYRKGMELLESSEKWNLRQAMECFLKAAQKGHIEATFQLGYLYLYGGSQILVNADKAIECFTIASEKGLVISNYYLGLCYYVGVGVEKNEKKAFELFNKAYNNGYVPACVMLCECYQYGIGTEVNMEEARRYNNFARQAQLPNAELKYIQLLMPSVL